MLIVDFYWFGSENYFIIFVHLLLCLLLNSATEPFSLLVFSPTNMKAITIGLSVFWLWLVLVYFISIETLKRLLVVVVVVFVFVCFFFLNLFPFLLLCIFASLHLNIYVQSGWAHIINSNNVSSSFSNHFVSVALCNMDIFLLIYSRKKPFWDSLSSFLFVLAPYRADLCFCFVSLRSLSIWVKFFRFFSFCFLFRPFLFILFDFNNLLCNC